jgi:hypothetical protein
VPPWRRMVSKPSTVKTTTALSDIATSSSKLSS